MSRIKEKLSVKTIVGIIVFASLIGSIIYVTVRLLTSSDISSVGQVLKSQYSLMLLQCLLGVAVMLLPGLLERKFSIDVPDYMEVMYFIFLYCAIYLGEVRSFYYYIPHWDTVLHAFSGAMLGALGYTVVSLFNDSEKVKIKLNPLFVTLFAFCFAVAAGAVWEIYEYVADGLLGLNMQKFTDVNGTVFVGRDALGDTMGDIIVDTLSAFAVTFMGYIISKIRERFRKKAKSPAE